MKSEKFSGDGNGTNDVWNVRPASKPLKKPGVFDDTM